MHKLSLFAGLALGLIFTIFVVGISLKVAAPSMFFKEVKSPYEFDKTLRILKDRVDAKEEWHVIEVVDTQEEIMSHLGVDIGRLKIIRFYNTKYASELLSEDDSKLMATQMQLSISVYEKSDGQVMIGLDNRYIVARLFSMRKEGAIMQKVVSQLEEVLSFTHFRFTIF